MRNLQLISDVARSFLSREDFDARMARALTAVGNAMAASRVYAFLDGAGGGAAGGTHEWCAPGIAPLDGEPRAIPYAAAPSWRAMLAREGRICCEHVGSLPPDLREALEPRGVRSLIAHALVGGEGTAGFVGIEDCGRERRWDDLELALLKAVAGLVSSAHERELDRRRLAASEANFRRFFDTVDDIMIVGDMDGSIVYVNAATTRKLGFTQEELQGASIIQLHPEDKRDEAARILAAMLRRELDHCPIEVARKDGVRVPVETRIWFGTWDGKERIFGLSKDLSAEQEALQKFTRLFESNPALMVISDAETGTIVDVNDAFLERLGYARAEVVGRTSAELALFPQELQRRWLANELLQTGRIRNVELEVRRRDGAILHGLFSGVVVASQGRRYLLTVMVDISATAVLRARLASERRRMANVIEGTRLGTWEWNVQTGETIFNERWAEMLGYTLAELEPVSIDTWMRLAHPDDLAESDRLLHKHFAGELDHYEHEVRLRHKDGHWIWVLDSGKVIERDATGRPLWMFGTHADITHRKRLEEEVRELSIHDDLTGLYNRRYVLSRLQGIAAEFLRRGRSFCISILDLDRFKDVNDSRGHPAGDSVLRQFAALLGGSVRPYDLVARHGGDEFLVVSLDADLQDCARTMDRILQVARTTTFQHGGDAVRITCSCGIASSGEGAPESFSIEAMIARADERVYRAKAKGRDRVVTG